MKTLKLIFFGMVLFFSNALTAQVAVTVNIGSPPQWGPYGYSEVRYYYLPDVEAYYDVQSSMFIYYGGGVWVHRSYLPEQYGSYDLYNGYKVVMTDYHGEAPFDNFIEYKKKYGRGYHVGKQKTIGERPGKKKYQEKKNFNGHPHEIEKHNSNENNKQDKEKGGSQGNEKNKQNDHGHGKGKH